MERKSIAIFLTAHKKKFPKNKRDIIQSHLEMMPDKNFLYVQTANYESPSKFFILSLFFGIFGVDRFMLEQTELGVVKLLTCGGLFVWWLIDLFFIIKIVRKTNFQTFKMHANY